MRVLVCGDRKYKAYERIKARLMVLPAGTVIIEGEARGADSLARNAAKDVGLTVERYPADWERYGRAAGPIRNKQMLDAEPDLVIAFHSNIRESKGTLNMIQQALKALVDVELYE